jgi:hypothetical protein
MNNRGAQDQGGQPPQEAFGSFTEGSHGPQKQSKRRPRAQPGGGRGVEGFRR